MSHVISIEQAATRLDELVSALGPGDEIVLLKDQAPVARIVPHPQPARAPRVPGSAKGILTIVSEDDEHLNDFKDYMP